jgi:DNA-binding LacI/PurR family transcriptional regulator
MGREAVRILLELLNDNVSARQLYLDCTQVVGDSVAELPE